LSKNLKHAENDYYDDNDDQDDFDAYLQEYVSKYEIKEAENVGDQQEKNEIIKAKRRHHHHHRRRHHHHHHRRHHHDHHRHHHHHESCQRHHSNKKVKSNKNKNLVTLFRPMITESSGHCRLFEIDCQVNAGLRAKSKSSTKNTQYSRCTCRKSNLKEDSCSNGKNDNHHHHRRRKNKHNSNEDVDKFPFEQRAKTSKKRKLKKEKFGKSEEHLEIKASINKSSKLDDSASNLSYTSLTSKKGN